MLPLHGNLWTENVKWRWFSTEFCLIMSDMSVKWAANGIKSEAGAVLKEYREADRMKQRIWKIKEYETIGTETGREKGRERAKSKQFWMFSRGLEWTTFFDRQTYRKCMP